MSWTIMDLNRDQLRDLLIKWNEALEVCREGVERWGCDPGRVELLVGCDMMCETLEFLIAAAPEPELDFSSCSELTLP